MVEDSTVAVLRLPDVGELLAGLPFWFTEEEVDADALHLIAVFGYLQLRPRNLHGLHRAAGGLSDAHTPSGSVRGKPGWSSGENET